MKTGFHDSTNPKKIDPKHTPEGGKRSPWDFRAPQYDERSSCFVNAGTNYGEGHKMPVGTFGNAKNTNEVPKGRVNTLKIREE